MQGNKHKKTPPHEKFPRKTHNIGIYQQTLYTKKQKERNFKKMSILFIIIGSGILTYSIMILSIPILQKISVKYNFVDTPNDRKIHHKPIPNSGGIAIYLSILPTLIFLAIQNQKFTGLIISATLITGLGILDDKINLNPKLKLLGQCLSTLAVLHSGILIQWITNPFGGVLIFNGLSYPITLLWIIAVINAFNLIDGIDGLATGITCISCFALGIIAFKTNNMHATLLAITLLSSACGFFKYNKYPAKIFMGDSGAMLIGLLLGCISVSGVLKSTLSLSFFSPLLILAFPLSDTLYAIFRRLKNKQKLFTADKKHLHHQLINKGFNIPQIVTGICSLSAILSAIAIIITLPKNMMLYASLGLITCISILIKPIRHKFKSSENPFFKLPPQPPVIN
ncbi:MAG: MraY family glycosyltransferase [bacterium]